MLIKACLDITMPPAERSVLSDADLFNRAYYSYGMVGIMIQSVKSGLPGVENYSFMNPSVTVSNVLNTISDLLASWLNYTFPNKWSVYHHIILIYILMNKEVIIC